MYQVKDYSRCEPSCSKENEHFFKGLEYQAQASDDGFTRVIVTDSPECPGNPIQYVASILGQSMARVAY